jgi:hypothetical protein
MIAFRASTAAIAVRQVMFRVPPQMSIGQADLDATIAPRSEASVGPDLRSFDLERVDADLVGFWRHVQNAQGLPE